MTPMAEARAKAQAEREEAAARRKRDYAQARLGFKLLCAPIVLGVAWLIYACGYWTGWGAALASIGR